MNTTDNITTGCNYFLVLVLILTCFWAAVPGVAADIETGEKTAEPRYMALQMCWFSPEPTGELFATQRPPLPYNVGSASFCVDGRTVGFTNNRVVKELSEKTAVSNSSWPSFWYLAALLALIGMLISSLVANKIRRERDAAKQANKLKSDFLAHISHEIRTPMNAILGFSQILRAQLPEPRHQQYLSALTSSGNTLLRLINDLLDLAKIEAGKFELQPSAVALQSIALDVQNIFMHVVEEKKLEFLVELDENLPEALYIDEVRLRQILFNLLKNAVKFTEQGHVKLSIQTLPQADKNVVDLRLIVSDTGIGIPTEELETIFEPFTQRRQQNFAKYAGTGLGLSIAKRLVAIIGGEISVVSQVAKGSTFTVILRRIPKASPAALVQQRKGNPVPNIRFDQEAAILVIDPVDGNRMLLREFLRFTKISIVETISITDGIEWCMAIKPDLILLDHTTCTLSTPAVVQHFNQVKETMNIPVIVIGAAAENIGNVSPGAVIFDSWLTKPLLLDEVMATLSRFLPHKTGSVRTDEDLVQGVKGGYVLPDFPQVQQKISGLGERLPGLMRTLVGNMLMQWQENRDTFIINEIKTFAKEVERLASEYRLDFLGAWARELLRQIQVFDMEHLPTTFGQFPLLVDLIKKACRPDQQ